MFHDRSGYRSTHIGPVFEWQLKKCSVSKFVDIPVRDFKISRLHHFPHLQVCGAAPSRTQFTRSNNDDRCASNSLASARYSINFQKKAEEIVGIENRELQGTENALDEVLVHFGRSVLLTWIQARIWMRKVFCWSVVVFIWRRSSSHAWRICWKFIYDANDWSCCVAPSGMHRPW